MSKRKVISEGEGVAPIPSLSEHTPPDIVAPEYEIVGIERTPDSKIWFQGRNWHLDRLTSEDVAYLSNFPEAFPYLKIG